MNGNETHTYRESFFSSGFSIFKRYSQLNRTTLIANHLTDVNSIEVREGWKKYYLALNLVWIVIYSMAFLSPEQRKGSVDFFFGKWSFAKLPFILFFTAVPCIGLFYLFDKRVKVRIDSDGIWSRRTGTLPWDHICYFSSTVSKMRSDGDIYKLHITPKDSNGLLDNEVILTFRRMDKNFDEIRPIVEFYAKKYNIEDMGHGSEE